MRIIAGLAKGRLLFTPRGRKTRFTSDKVRGSLFNILGQDLSGKSFLDLFAGVGSVGLEAFSRGATRVVFVEENVQNANYICRNLENCGLSQGAKIYNLSFRKALRKLSSSFDYIYLDPPYSIYKVEKILQDLIYHDIINQFSLVIVEHSKKDTIPSKLNSLELIRQKVYGQTLLSFYQCTDKHG